MAYFIKDTEIEILNRYRGILNWLMVFFRLPIIIDSSQLSHSSEILQVLWITTFLPNNGLVTFQVLVLGTDEEEQ